MRNEDQVPQRESEWPLTPDERRSQWVAVGILMAPLILGALVTVSPERASWFGIEGPQCPSQLIWSAGCPGCGLTRSVALTMHGRLRSAWQVNPAGICVVAFAIMGLFVRGDILRRGRIGTLHEALLRRGRHLFLLVLLLSWLGRGIMHGELRW